MAANGANIYNQTYLLLPLALFTSSATQGTAKCDLMIQKSPYNSVVLGGMMLQEFFVRVEWLFGSDVDQAAGLKSAAKVYTSRNAIYYSAGVSDQSIP